MTVSITSNHNRNIGGKQTGNIAHNGREFTPHNVDPALTVNNIVYKDRGIREVFIESFKKAIDEYNKKQKRKDRIKYDGENYFEHLFGVKPESESAKVILTSNARGKHEINSFNEELFQIGDCYEFGNFIRNNQGNLIDKNGAPVKWNENDNTYYDINGNAVTNSSCLVPNPKAEKVREILSTFYMGGRFKVVNDQNGVPSLKRLEENDTAEPDLVIPSFEERNPNFRIIYAIMHNDEWCGTPHIHIDYLPVGEGYTKGLEKQLGFERALKNMGFENKNTAYKEWREKERQILKEICNYYGLETKTKEEERENNRNKTYSTTEYKEIVRTACADAQAIIERAEREAKAIKERALADATLIIENAQKEASQILDDARQELQETQAKNSTLVEEDRNLEQSIEQKRKQLDILTDSVAKMPRRSIFSLGDFVINKNKYEAFLSLVENVKHYFHNTLTSDEDRQAAADERKRQEEITANMQQVIRQQARQMAELMIQNAINELDDKEKEYEQLIEKENLKIFNMANKIADHALSDYAKLGKTEKKKLLKQAFAAEEREQEKTSYNKNDEGLSLF